VYELQLLRDMDVRWSSTFFMIECAIKCQPVCIFYQLCTSKIGPYMMYSTEISFTFQVIYKFLQQKDFEELRKHELTEYDWEALYAFLDILSVRTIFANKFLVFEFCFMKSFHMSFSKHYPPRRPQHYVTRSVIFTPLCRSGRNIKMNIQKCLML